MWDAIVAIGTWALVVGTVLSVWLQGKYMRRALSAEVFARLSERWDSREMRARRKRLAQHLRDNPGQSAPQMIEDVIDFFEDLGTIVRRKYLEKEPVWQSFSTAARHYWVACGQKYVTDMREEYSDSTFYSEFEHLVDQMEKEEMRRRKKRRTEVAISTRAAAKFLEFEANL